MTARIYLEKKTFSGQTGIWLVLVFAWKHHPVSSLANRSVWYVNFSKKKLQDLNFEIDIRIGVPVVSLVWLKKRR